jgi:1,4-dihydroxy-2-naphthoyl-CoA hydrolase
MSDAPQDFSDMLNQHRGGWNQAMGLRFLRASADEVGIVHGGVHAGVIETLASTGAALSAGARGQSVVGLDNSTTFIRAIRDGTVRATARPLTRGRRTQVWETTIVDAAGRLVATGRVRLLCLDPGAELAGEPAGLKT